MVYNYTKPRGPIAAMYSSPGPCYALPGLVGQQSHDPRSVHNKRPAYVFGIRHGKFKEDSSPGPCYYPNTKVFRDGIDGTPQYSLYSRPKDGTCFRTPGPGAYMPENAGTIAYIKCPQYSFGTRHNNRRSDNTPAANMYTLPGMLGATKESRKLQAPCYSLTGRSKTGSFHEDLQKTPGPGTYNTTEPSVNRNRCPVYSMTSRNPMPGDNTKKPGPGAHSPERCMNYKKEAPKFSFGIRHTQYEAPLIVQCPDDY